MDWSVDVRDAWGAWPHIVTSEHFAIKWGTEASVDIEAIIRVMVALEAAHDVYVDELGHRSLQDGSPYLFNVYITGTSTVGPIDVDAGGYYARDPHGWPLVAIEASTLAHPGYAEVTAVHELYHAVQDATGSYPYGGKGAWFWEATAVWASSVLYPDRDDAVGFLFAYAMRPHLPVDWFDYPDSGTLEELYQYGAFLFPWFLGEAVDRRLIREVWDNPRGAKDPLEALRQRLEQRGEDLDELWLDHCAANVLWDYADGELYGSIVDTWASLLPTADQRIAGTLPWGGGEWTSPAESRRPMRYGSNTWRLPLRTPRRVAITIDGAPTGTHGSPAQFGARLVLERKGRITYFDVPFEGTRGEITLPKAIDGTLYLVVGAWTAEHVDGVWEEERFDYGVAVEPVVAEVFSLAPLAPDPAGCAAAPHPHAAWMLALLGLRRRRHSAGATTREAGS